MPSRYKVPARADDNVFAKSLENRPAVLDHYHVGRDRPPAFPIRLGATQGRDGGPLEAWNPGVSQRMAIGLREYGRVRDAVAMPTYIATIKARFPETVEDDLDAFKVKLRERKAFRLPGHDIVQNGPHTWITASFDIEDSTPAAACMAALRDFEQDAHSTVGAFDAVDMGTIPPEGMIQRIPL